MSDEISSFSFLIWFFSKWRIIASQYCAGLCHILTWIGHRSICPLPPGTLLPSPCSSRPSPPAVRETPVWFLGGEDPLEKSMAAPSSVLAWRIPWAEGPGGLPQGVVKSRAWLSNSAQHSTSVRTWFQHSRASVSAEPLGQLSDPQRPFHPIQTLLTAWFPVTLRIHSSFPNMWPHFSSVPMPTQWIQPPVLNSGNRSLISCFASQAFWGDTPVVLIHEKQSLPLYKTQNLRDAVW